MLRVVVPLAAFAGVAMAWWALLTPSSPRALYWNKCSQCHVLYDLTDRDPRYLGRLVKYRACRGVRPEIQVLGNIRLVPSRFVPNS